MEDSLLDYQLPVYTSLMEKHVFFGIGETAFYLIAILTIILMSLLSIYCIIIGVLAIFVCKIICKNEPQLLEFLFQNLLQSKIYAG